MNVFELGIIAAPLAGLLSGVCATAQHGLAGLLASAAAGLVIGVASYLAPVLLASALLDRTTNRSHDRLEQSSVLERFAGTLLVLYAIASPFVAWFLAELAVSRLFGPP